MPDPNSLALPDLFSYVADAGLVRRLIELARAEDLGPSPSPNDVTSSLLVDDDEQARCAIVARERGVVAGLAAVPTIVEVFQASIEIEDVAADGDQVEAGTTLATVSGNRRAILAMERTLLNLLGRLCGVATLTRRYVDAIQGATASVFDTRKTTPGLRALEKYAVRCGGGHNHRYSLFDGVLVKDNHIAGIPLAELTKRLGDVGRQAWSMRMEADLSFVEVEVDSLEQLDRVLAVEHGLIDFVLLDNFSLDALREAVQRRNAVNADVQLEASGGVTLETIRDIAETGVERISCGALTHAATWLDVGLDALTGESSD